MGFAAFPSGKLSPVRRFGSLPSAAALLSVMLGEIGEVIFSEGGSGEPSSKTGVSIEPGLTRGRKRECLRQYAFISTSSKFVEKLLTCSISNTSFEESNRTLY